jgi:hypothetical protein
VTAAAKRALERVRRIALAFPEVTERPSHGMPTFFVADKKTFANFADHHHGVDHTALWFAAPPGAQEALVATGRYFRPPYVGFRGWVGVAFDARTDWVELADLLRDAYVHVAPRKLAALLEG